MNIQPKRVVRFWSDGMLLVLLLTTAGLAPKVLGQVSTNVEFFLPKASVTDAMYVQIERDPALDDYTKRIQAARAKDPQWFQEYGQKHPYKAGMPGPYDEKLGVTKEEYERYSHPMNHFREVGRKAIKIRRSDANGAVQLDLEGRDLLLTQVVVNTKQDSAKIPADVLPISSFVDVDVASLPPGAHRGVHYRTPDAKIGTTKRRDSLLIGELKDSNSGIIHYSVNTPGQVKMVYVQFGK